MQKSSIFYCGVSPELKDDMSNVWPIPEGRLPVRNLGYLDNNQSSGP